MFNGFVRKYKHFSDSCGCDMTFSVFLPPPQQQENNDGGAPVLLWLSGLTCSDDNFTQKAGAQRAAAARGVALVAPDTSPRGLGVPGEDEGWDLGTGAGFYVDATREPWAVEKDGSEGGGGGGSKKGYRMFSYVTVDLVRALRGIEGLDATRMSVSGHSMGGHGALVVALRRPEMFRSVSAFAPICNPTRVPWGKKAFSAYLGGGGGGEGAGGEKEKEKESGESGEEIPEAWKHYDACELIKSYKGERSFDVLVDVGTADEFLEEQLSPGALEGAAAEAAAAATAASSPSPSAAPKITVRVNRREGYDHSYYFIASFIDDHVEHAARALLS